MTERELLNKLNIDCCAKCQKNIHKDDIYYGDKEFKLCMNCYTMLPQHFKEFTVHPLNSNVRTTSTSNINSTYTLIYKGEII